VLCPLVVVTRPTDVVVTTPTGGLVVGVVREVAIGFVVVGLVVVGLVAVGLVVAAPSVVTGPAA
jgi:hypothetical protein